MKTKQKLVAEETSIKKLSPKLKRIAGCVKLPIDFDEKKALDAYFQSKHQYNIAYIA
jgi:hypothetical protein